MERLAFDVAWAILGLLLAVRLIRKLQPDVVRFGIGMLIFDLVGNYLIWRFYGVTEMEVDIAHGSTVLAAAIVSRGDWARFVPNEYLRTEYRTGEALGKSSMFVAAVLSLLIYVIVAWLVL